MKFKFTRKLNVKNNLFIIKSSHITIRGTQIKYEIYIIYSHTLDKSAIKGTCLSIYPKT